MKGYNVIVVFNETEDAVLMCRRRRDPFQGLLNFVGGKIEKMRMVRVLHIGNWKKKPELPLGISC